VPVLPTWLARVTEDTRNQAATPGFGWIMVPIRCGEVQPRKNPTNGRRDIGLPGPIDCHQRPRAVPQPGHTIRVIALAPDQRSTAAAAFRAGREPLTARPEDTNWTGAEIKSCCRLASLLDVPLGQ
jgi:hypothetical protein